MSRLRRLMQAPEQKTFCATDAAELIGKRPTKIIFDFNIDLDLSVCRIFLCEGFEWMYDYPILRIWLI